MATVSWNVQIEWPAPFATFERLLSVLDLSLLRIMTLLPTVTPSPSDVAGVIVLVALLRAAYRLEQRDQVSYLHSSSLLLLSFLVLPATSMKVCERCSMHFRDRRPRYSRQPAGRSFACSRRASSYGPTACCFTTLILPLIANPPGSSALEHSRSSSLYAFLLFRVRRLINPLGCDARQAIRVRNESRVAKPELRALEFLFSCYRPGAHGFEVYESFRRIAMTGLIRYVAKTSGPPVAGILLSLVSVVVFREIGPFENREPEHKRILSSFA